PRRPRTLPPTLFPYTTLFRSRHRTGLTADGRLLAQDIEVLLDGGAYGTLSPVVLSRGLIHAAGPYACENVRIRGCAMFTNAVPLDRKSTRLNSSHVAISYAVF